MSSGSRKENEGPQGCVERIDRPFGSIELRRAPWWYTAELGALEVGKSERNKGHGKELVRVAVERARQLGIVHVVAAVYPDNPPSRSVLRACGFKRITSPTAISQRTGKPVEIWQLIL